MVNLCMQSKKTALDVAVECEHWLVVELLMKADQVSVILTILNGTPCRELQDKIISQGCLMLYLNLVNWSYNFYLWLTLINTHNA